jgi:hypothetical protein
MRDGGGARRIRRGRGACRSSSPTRWRRPPARGG